MTISRWYLIRWKTEDGVLDAVLERYVSHKNVNLAEALKKASDIEYLFGVTCRIESRSAVGVLPVHKRRVVKRKMDIDCPVVWQTADGQLNDVLYAYCVSDRKAVKRLFGKV